MLDPDSQGDADPQLAPPLRTARPAQIAAAPADLEPAPQLRERLGWYSAAVVLTCLLIVFGLRLDQADLKAPFYYDLDSLLILPLVKATQERGFGGHWRNERVGAPGIQELHDFPVIDHLHFLAVWLLGQCFSNVILVYNLYYLLTFPLTTLTAMIAFRHLGLSLPAAAVGGVLYSFLPFHYQRWEHHYFLSAYWLVPVSLLPVLAICKGNLPFFRSHADGTYRRSLFSWPSLGLVILGVAIASGGAYYAFFTCAILAFAGCYGWVVHRTWRSAAAAASLIAIIVAFGLVNHIPTIRYQAQYGRNPVTDRLPEEADIYGLKVTHLLLPINDHNLRVMNQIKVIYLSGDRPSENENQTASLGVVGAAGFVGLVVLLLVPLRRPWWPYNPLAALVVFCYLLATIGGFGAIFNLLVTAQIRAYNRISVFIAFLCLFAALWAIDHFLLTRRHPRARLIRFGGWAAVFLIGFLDQTPFPWFKSGIIKTLDEQATRFRADAEFFRQIEERMDPGAKIFCLPYAAYPERQPTYKMATYEHSRGYIHTTTLAWSFGAMKGREVDAWQIDVGHHLSKENIRERLKRIVAAGFDGVFIDGRGFPIEGPLTAPMLINEIQKAYQAEPRRSSLRLPEIIHSDGVQVFLDLRPYRDAWRANPDNDYEGYARHERDWVAVIWLEGFFSPEPTGSGHEFRFGPRDATAWFINPTDRDRRFRIRMTFGGTTQGIRHFKLTGLVNEEFDVETRPGDLDAKRYGREMTWEITVPPGRHFLRIRCTPPPDFMPNEVRKLCYYIMDFHKHEIP